jgi:hypothetical protein
VRRPTSRVSVRSATLAEIGVSGKGASCRLPQELKPRETGWGLHGHEASQVAALRLASTWPETAWRRSRTTAAWSRCERRARCSLSPSCRTRRYGGTPQWSPRALGNSFETLVGGDIVSCGGLRANPSPAGLAVETSWKRLRCKLAAVRHVTGSAANAMPLPRIAARRN